MKGKKLNGFEVIRFKTVIVVPLTCFQAVFSDFVVRLKMMDFQ
jgi:hypothetical protein